MVRIKAITAYSTLLALAVGVIYPVSARGPDFDGDGYEDAAMGMPDKMIGGKKSAGNVLVTYGSDSGLTAIKQGLNILNRSQEDIKGSATESARFGSALAWGDFNGDGYDDLAVGVSGDTVGEAHQAGSVQVFYGKAFCGGLCADSDQILHRSTQVVGSAITGARFGAALAAGDFNADGHDDLAVGVPGDSINGKAQAGSIHLVYGGPAGLQAAGTLPNEIFHLDLPGAVINQQAAAKSNAHYGKALASGDFNCDGSDDLAVGIPEHSDGKAQTGAVHVIYGSYRRGLAYNAGPGGWLWKQGVFIKDAAEAGDQFGFSLAAGNFNGDKSGGKQCSDLAIGVPFEDVFHVGNTTEDTGAVQVVYGSSAGLVATKNQLWNLPVITGAKQTDLYLFGWDLAAGDFNQDGNADLMVGAIGAGFLGEAGDGSVGLLVGGASGLSASQYYAYSQGDNYVLGNPEPGDLMGYCLGGGNFDGKKGDELLACVPFDNYYGGVEQGIVEEIHFKPAIIGNKNVLTTAPGSAGWIYDACSALDFNCKGVDAGAGEDSQHFALAVTKPRP